MLDNIPEELVQIVQKAKQDEMNEKSSTNAVNDALSHMAPQRSNNQAKSQNKR